MQLNINGFEQRYEIEQLIHVYEPFEAFEEVAIGDSENRLDIDVTEKSIVCSRKKDTRFAMLKVPVKVRMSLKNQVKATLVQMYERFGYERKPWGILTGIRPTKIVLSLFEEGVRVSEIFRILTQDYLISEERARWLLRIARVQQSYLTKNLNRYHLYLHIPFCPSRCSYCSFATTIGAEEARMDAYVDRLIEEMEQTAPMLEEMELGSIYIGGGTPTALPEASMERLLRAISKHFKNPSEWTVEAGRVDTLTPSYLRLLHDCGVDRISINPQTMNDETLERIHRTHDVATVKEYLNLAKQIGFQAINMDFILGLPGEGEKEFAHSLEVLSDLMPDVVTFHTLAVKKGAKLHEDRQRLLQDVADMEKMQQMATEWAESRGYQAYYLYRQKHMLGNLENVGYAQPEKASIYNMVMMDEWETVIGLGVGAATKIYYEEDRHEMVHGFKDLKVYMERMPETVEKRRMRLEERKQ